MLAIVYQPKHLVLDRRGITSFSSADCIAKRNQEFSVREMGRTFPFENAGGFQWIIGHLLALVETMIKKDASKQVSQCQLMSLVCGK